MALCFQCENQINDSRHGQTQEVTGRGQTQGSNPGVKRRGQKPGKEVGTGEFSISLPVWPISDGPNPVLSRSIRAVRTREGDDAAGAARHSAAPTFGEGKHN